MKLSVLCKRCICSTVAPLLTILALSFCGHAEQQSIESSIVDTTRVRIEKEVYQVGEELPKVEVQPATPSRPVKNTTPYIRNAEDEDNLRGFDPASEDDMLDNGMRRYMENDDEEGWD